MFNLKLIQHQYFLPFLLALTFFIISLFTLGDYGINWDAPFRMMRGQALAHFIFTGQKNFSDPKATLSPVLIKPNQSITRYDPNEWEGMESAKIPDRVLIRNDFEKSKNGQQVSFYQSVDWNGNLFVDQSGSGHLPFGDILAALFNKLFYSTLHLLGDIESYQLSYILISSLGVFIVSAFVLDLTGSLFASFIAGICLAFFPLFFSEAHFNMKDPLQASLFAGSIWSFWGWIKRNSFKWFLIFLLFTIIALGIKWNVIFLPFIICPWLFAIRKTAEFKKWFDYKKIFIYFVIFLLGFFLFITLVSPDHWSNPFLGLVETVQFYKEIGIRPDPLQNNGFILSGGFNIFPLSLLLFQTPEIVLLLTAIFLLAFLFKKTELPLKSEYLLLAWVLVPVTRHTLPHVWFYNGLRQIMEALPALAILAGLGANHLISYNFKLNVSKPLLTVGLSVLICIILVIPIITLHPNQNVYFNNLIGGVKGAETKGFIDWSVTYGNVYKQAALYLNANAQKDANIAILDGRSFAISPLWLRNDISFSPSHFSGFDQQGEYILTLKDSYNPPIFAHRYLDQFLEPIHTIRAGQTILLYIYKNDSSHLKSNIQKEKEEVTKNFTQKKLSSFGSRFIELDLGQERKITRILLDLVPPPCLNYNYHIIDEYISFSYSKFPDLSPDPKLMFSQNERKNIGKRQVEFWFPAERARFIRIYPQSQFSCFNGGQIVSVSYIP